MPHWKLEVSWQRRMPVHDKVSQFSPEDVASKHCAGPAPCGDPSEKTQLHVPLDMSVTLNPLVTPHSPGSTW
jgi:hypothetical protein